MSPISDPGEEQPEGTDDVDLDEEAHPSEPHPDEPRAEGPMETSEIHGPVPEALSDVGEPRPDEPRIERIAPEDEEDGEDAGDRSGSGEGDA